MKYVRVSAKVFQTEVDSGLALLNSETNTYFLLNGTGSIIWNELGGPKSVNDLCEVIAKHSDISALDCKDDVQALIDALTAKGLIKLSDDSAN